MSLEEPDYINRITLELMVNKSRLKNVVEFENHQRYDNNTFKEHLVEIIEITNTLIMDDKISEQFSREILIVFDKYMSLCLEHINRNIKEL